MRRRTWLRTAGSLAIAGLAGCSSDGGGGGTETATPTATATEPPTATATPTESTEDHLSEANAEVDRALQAFDEESEKLSRATDEQVSVDVSGITEHLDAAERALDAASVSDPTADQETAIEALRAMVASFRDMTTGMEAMAVGFDELRVGLDGFENQEFGPAASSFASAVDSFDRARGAIEGAIADTDGVDAESVAASVAEYRGGLADLLALTEASSTLAAGTRLLSLAFEQYFAAATAYDDGDYAAAVEPFGAARDYADRAAAAYTTPEGTPSDIAGSIAGLQCSAEKLRDGSEHFRLAAEAAADGDSEERQRQEERARSALNRDCGGSSGRVTAVVASTLGALVR